MHSCAPLGTLGNWEPMATSDLMDLDTFWGRLLGLHYSRTLSLKAFQLVTFFLVKKKSLQIFLRSCPQEPRNPVGSDLLRDLYDKYLMSPKHLLGNKRGENRCLTAQPDSVQHVQYIASTLHVHRMSHRMTEKNMERT